MKIFLRMMAFILLMLVAWLTSTRRAEHRWVAFMSINVSSFYGDIHLMSEGTSEPYLIQPIAGCVRTPKWSPDGRWLSYKNECTDQQEFLRIRPGGIVPEEITAPIADGVQYMAWSPDGQRVLIERENFDIYIVDADGERLLIKNYLIGDWSPDSEWVYGIPVGQEDDVLERIHAQTGRVEALFSTQDYIFPRSWSPDDQWMVIDRLTDDDDELFISNADGSDLQRITEDFPGEQIASPLWSPDGEWIAFTGGNSSFESHIYRTRPDGR